MEKTVNNIKIHNKTFNLINKKNILKVMVINQLLLFQTPVTILAKTNENNKSDNMELKNEDYIDSVADFYGVDKKIIASIFEDITENQSKELIKDPEPELSVINQINEEIENKNVVTSTSSIFDFSSKGSDKINEIKTSEVGALYEKYGKMYGIDPNLLMARDMQESGLNHNIFNPHGAYGISQIEHTLFNSQVSVFNYETNSYETFVITEEGACDLETNIKYGAAKMQERLRSYGYNIFISLQAYNYGPSMNFVLENYALEKGITKEDVLANKDDFGWLKYVDDLHYNPSNYLSNWEYQTYGDNEYINHVMRYIPEDILVIKDENGNDIIYNLQTNKILNLEETGLTNYVNKLKIKEVTLADYMAIINKCLVKRKINVSK